MFVPVPYVASVTLPASPVVTRNVNGIYTPEELPKGNSCAVTSGPIDQVMREVIKLFSLNTYPPVRTTAEFKGLASVSVRAFRSNTPEVRMKVSLMVAFTSRRTLADVLLSSKSSNVVTEVPPIIERNDPVNVTFPNSKSSDVELLVRLPPILIGATTVRLLPAAKVRFVKLELPDPISSSVVVLLVNTTVDEPPTNVPLLFHAPWMVWVNAEPCKVAPGPMYISPANVQPVGAVTPDPFVLVMSIDPNELLEPETVVKPVPPNTTLPVDVNALPRLTLTDVVGENVIVPALVTVPLLEKLPRMVWLSAPPSQLEPLAIFMAVVTIQPCDA